MDTLQLTTNGVEANRNWFEIWNLERDGTLRNCINFYDFALDSAAAWAAHCFTSETARTEEAYQIVHAFKDSSGKVQRNVPVEVDSKDVTSLLSRVRSKVIKGE